MQATHMYAAHTYCFSLDILFRYFSICSSYQIFHAELEKFEKLLLQNGYPKVFMDRCIKMFLDKMISPPPKVQTPTVSKLLIPIVLPYMGNHAKFRSVNNYRNWFPQLILIYKFVWFLNHYAVCLIFSISKIVFLLIWDLMWCISLSVNAVMHCIWAKHVDIYTHTNLWALWNFGFDWQTSFMCFKITYFRSF
jgi:hypothetical protein